MIDTPTGFAARSGWELGWELGWGGGAGRGRCGWELSAPPTFRGSNPVAPCGVSFLLGAFLCCSRALRNSTRSASAASAGGSIRTVALTAALQTGQLFLIEPPPSPCSPPLPLASETATETTLSRSTWPHGRSATKGWRPFVLTERSIAHTHGPAQCRPPVCSLAWAGRSGLARRTSGKTSRRR